MVFLGSFVFLFVCGVFQLTAQLCHAIPPDAPAPGKQFPDYFPADTLFVCRELQPTEQRVLEIIAKQAELEVQYVEKDPALKDMVCGVVCCVVVFCTLWLSSCAGFFLSRKNPLQLAHCNVLLWDFLFHQPGQVSCGNKCMLFSVAHRNVLASFGVYIHNVPQHPKKRNTQLTLNTYIIVINISNHSIPYHIVSYHITSHHILSYHIISYHVISCHIVIHCLSGYFDYFVKQSVS